MHVSQTSTTSRSSLVEGRPSTMYFHTGIGGAGNYHKAYATDASNVPTPTRPRYNYDQRSYLPRSLHSLVSTGIGGAGNIRGTPQVATLSAEEELARSRVRESHSPLRWFVGIGGMGNRTRKRYESPSSSMTCSTSSQYSGQALPLGAAEILKRKMGELLMRKTSAAS